MAEREATHRAIALSEVADTAILLVHVSAREAIGEIEAARGRGTRVFAETCPHYLLLSAADLDRPGLEGAKYMCAPPMRDPANREHVWRALERGVFDVFSSDHVPFSFGGADGKTRHGEDAPFSRIANGLPGIETRLPLLFSEGVQKGRIDLPRFVALSAANAAKIYGLYPRKGTVAVGADADLALWDRHPRGHDHEDDPARPHGLHAIRRHAGQGLARDDAIPRGRGVGRRQGAGSAGSRSVPAAPALCGCPRRRGRDRGPRRRDASVTGHGVPASGADRRPFSLTTRA